MHHCGKINCLRRHCILETRQRRAYIYTSDDRAQHDRHTFGRLTDGEHQVQHGLYLEQVHPCESRRTKIAASSTRSAIIRTITGSRQLSCSEPNPLRQTQRQTPLRDDTTGDGNVATTVERLSPGKSSSCSSSDVHEEPNDTTTSSACHVSRLDGTNVSPCASCVD
jgi:hypothetical protein